MDAPTPPIYTYPSFWSALFAGLTVIGGGVWAVYSTIMARVRRSHDMESRVSALETEVADIRSDQKELHKEQSTIREMLAAQPTKDDLRDVRESLSAELTRAVDLIVAGKRQPAL